MSPSYVHVIMTANKCLNIQADNLINLENDVFACFTSLSLIFFLYQKLVLF